MNAREQSQWESGQVFARGGPTCGCKDLGCTCPVAVPEFARPSPERAALPSSTVEALDLMQELLSEINRLRYPLPRTITASVNAVQDFVRLHYPHAP